MPASIYLGHIICPVAVVAKINAKHGITEQQVRDGVQHPARPISAYWIDVEGDPRGPRVVALARMGDRRLMKVVLYPVGEPAEGTWRLGTAVMQT